MIQRLLFTSDFWLGITIWKKEKHLEKGWCLPEDEKKEKEPIFTDKVEKC